MSEKNIVVPEGMLRAVRVSYARRAGAYSEKASRGDLEAALRWLSENPIVPTKEQWNKLWQDCLSSNCGDGNYKLVSEWQRRMFLAPEVDRELVDLLWDANPFPNIGAKTRHDECVAEAFRRGQKAGSK